MKQSKVRQTLLFAGPLLVGTVNLMHPMVVPPVYQSIAPHIEWWITLHVFNLLLFPLLGLSAYLLVSELPGLAAAVSRIVIVLFIPLYAGFDALVGIGTGVLVWNAARLPANELSVMSALIDKYWASNITQSLAASGSIAWVIAMLAAAVAFTALERRRALSVLSIIFFVAGGWAMVNLFLPHPGAIPLLWWLITLASALLVFVITKPRMVPALLVLSGSLFGAAHVPPTGPLAMLCFITAAALARGPARETVV
jgi:hypothetical protein